MKGILGVEGKDSRLNWYQKVLHMEGVDYNEIFSPVIKHCSIRILMFVVN